MAVVAPVNQQSQMLAQRPSSPTVWFEYSGQLATLQLQRLDIASEFHIGTAFVHMRGTWHNTNPFPIDCLFALPLAGTVTSVGVRIGDQRLLETIVIPKDDAEQIQKEQAKMQQKEMRRQGIAVADEGDDEVVAPQPSPYEQYIPNLFRLPIPNVGPNEMVAISVRCIEPLDFFDKAYHFTLPLTFAPGSLRAGARVQDVVNIRCRIHSVHPAHVDSRTHRMNMLRREPYIELRAGDPIPDNAMGEREGVPSPANGEGQANSQGRDFHISYSTVTREIVGTFIQEIPDPSDVGQQKRKKEEGTFCLFVTPPTIESLNGFFGRDLVFLLDRSGSMVGDPFSEAVRALKMAIENLRPTDRFTIISFDHRQVYFREELVPASAQNVFDARRWIDQYVPERGGTDIRTPLEWAFELLNKEDSAALVLPFVVLLTDGCVMYEREICKFTHSAAQRIRLLTLGIGSYCNWFFLKMLAQIGKGFNDVVVYKENIFSKIMHLLDMASVPVLTDIQLDLPGIQDCELYPFPIPDLFIGAPLTISGRFTGQCPPQVTLEGKMYDGRVFRLPIQVTTSSTMPVGKVFLRQRIDLLTAKSWLEDSKSLQQDVVDLSCQESIPSAYTTMIAYETKQQPGQEDDDEGSNASLLRHKKKKRWTKNKKAVMALAGGGAFLVGAAAFSFGDIAATLGNAPVDALDGIGDFGADGECCGECGDFDCSECFVC